MSAFWWLSNYQADVEQCHVAATVFGVFLWLASFGGPRPLWCAHRIGISSRGESSTGAGSRDQKQKTLITKKPHVVIGILCFRSLFVLELLLCTILH